LQTNRKHCSFIASSLSTARHCTNGEALEQAYRKLDVWQNTLPAQFRAKLAEVREQLPVIFGPEFSQVLNHADLQEMNTQVDEQSGAIAGIIDWEGAEYGPFGVALGSLEVFLGICSGEGEWFWHPRQHYLRIAFYRTLCEDLMRYQFYQINLDAVEAARAFGFFIRYGSKAGQENEEGRLAAACLGAGLAEKTTAQPFLQQLSRSGY
jgi:hypothetical protein